MGRLTQRMRQRAPLRAVEATDPTPTPPLANRKNHLSFGADDGNRGRASSPPPINQRR